ncbi:S9 family peptidase [Corallococcus exiguus]|uniref:Prolyl oligopeptidase family serine peptidase n=1 Tax=Corallococcus exiguus TaxID=83462 RepID=A0A7X4YDG9_9BACT|nr:S9 family peptidase [Corallococcus exiguus]NBC42297.1 prolyl oligopeptidase family serine peptidase [Corallococcus exiguus]TNV56180.1 S9 family peptidase [Corallococcus exiguus]
MPLSLLAALALGANPAPAPHPFNQQDLVTLRRLSSPRVSPDGRQVAYVLRSTDMEANRGRTDLWLANLDGSAPRQLTSHPDSDTDPVWAPDGKSLFFLSSRGGSSQVWRLPLDGGEPLPVTKLPLDVNSFVLSRDGQQLAVALDARPDCADLACSTQRAAEASKKKTTGRAYDQLFARHWDTWKDGTRSHLFVVPVAGGTAVDVMKGMDADAPSKPFGGAEEFTFTPDGKGIVFAARDVGRTESWSTDLDLFLASVDGKTKPSKLTEKNRATDTSPVFSPDGKTLAYVAMSRPGFEADRFRVILRTWPGGQERVLTQDWDRSAGSLAWSKDGATLFTTANDVGQNTVFALDVATGKARSLTQGGNADGAQPAADGQVVYAMDDLDSPADLYAVKADGTGTRQLTQVNKDALAGLKFGAFEQFNFPGWNNETVHGYVVKPVDFDPKRQYPLAFLIHGGPQGSFGNHFHYRWNPQVYAGRGYVAVMIDFHGSTGYGQAFTDSISGDWGGKPLEDLQKGLNAALQKYSFIHKTKRCALGGSYGGYMINWIAGNWADGFQCLVNHDGIFDERAAYYDTEELWFPEWEHKALPWEKPESYEKFNPVNQVAKWKTPMLVIHGGKDYRVVDTQGIATFTALQRRGIPSRFLYFPDENHWVLKPQNSIQWHDEVLGWLDRWTRK